MTKKDYVAIARLLATQGKNIRKDDLVANLCLLFEHDNPNFDKDKFLRVCYAEQSIPNP